jgi:hypothetical protein
VFEYMTVVFEKSAKVFGHETVFEHNLAFEAFERSLVVVASEHSLVLVVLRHNQESRLEKE